MLHEELQGARVEFDVHQFKGAVLVVGDKSYVLSEDVRSRLVSDGGLRGSPSLTPNVSLSLTAAGIDIVREACFAST